jgi:hypothetical protein
MENRQRIISVLNELGERYQDRAVASLEQLEDAHDVHAFYRISEMFRLPEGDRIIHVQGYPGLSNDGEMRVYARLMDYDQLVQIRQQGEVSIGNEHEAVTQDFPNFGAGVFIPYDSEVLGRMLEENVPVLRGGSS